MGRMKTGQIEMDAETTGREVARVEHNPPAALQEANTNGLTLIERIIDGGGSLDIDIVERLVALQERQEERAAERAMIEALSAFQAECPLIPRGGLADTGKYEYTFAEYDDIVRTIRPHLVAHGLSFTHDSAFVDGGQIEVTCTLRHVAGATRKSTFRGPADTSGGKNSIQAIGSGRSYGKRYTLTDVLGLATEDDTDGVVDELITEAQAADLSAMLDECKPGTAPKILRWVGVNRVEEIPVRWYKDVVTMIEKARSA